MSSSDTGQLPYRLLTGDTTRTFCKRVSDALQHGYVLYGDPVMTFDGERMVTAQAVVLAGHHPGREAE
jgi:hypothetical protein